MNYDDWKADIGNKYGSAPCDEPEPEEHCESCRRRGFQHEPVDEHMDLREWNGGPRDYAVCAMCAKEIRAAQQRATMREEW
jgi:hypothetical protein